MVVETRGCEEEPEIQETLLSAHRQVVNVSNWVKALVKIKAKCSRDTKKGI